MALFFPAKCPIKKLTGKIIRPGVVVQFEMGLFFELIKYVER
jgi:hypothetical protein